MDNDYDIYIEETRSLLARRAAETGRRPLALVKTYGCQMNAHDSEKLEAMLRRMGYGKAERENEADLILLNTCCVRENAENHAFGNLGIMTRLKKDQRELRIVLCGCMTQREPVLERIRRSYKMVDVVFGALNVSRFPELLYRNLTTGRQVIEVQDEAGETIREEKVIHSRHFPFKASVNIMYGCDNFCSYCIVPYVRGRERSRPAADILDEIRLLADDGVKEIMLLGQNVNSYAGGFADLLAHACQIPGLERIRFMTSHPKDLSRDLVDVMRREKKICKHLHLPMQSGSSRILMAMNRKYAKEEYLRLAEDVKKSGIAMTTDIIVGFPGETEADFEDTLDVVRQVRFAGAFTFLYSKRSGTPAAEMPEPVDPTIANERFQQLLTVLNPIVAEEMEKQAGKVLSVLPEEVNAREPGFLSGRADNNTVVHFPADQSRIGELINVRITEAKGFYLLGELEVKANGVLYKS